MNFRRDAILGDRSCDGNPMRAHIGAGDVATTLGGWRFSTGVLQRELPPDVAEAWSGLAHRIGARSEFRAGFRHRRAVGRSGSALLTARSWPAA